MNNATIDNITQLFSHMSLSDYIKKFTLVLDLDETLVHSIITTDIKKINTLKTMNNLLLHYIDNDNHIFVFYRPYMLQFLREMSKYFNICVFTNGVKAYADIIVTMINTITSYTYISRWYSRTGEYPFYKYIYMIDNVDTEDVLIIDDNGEIWKDDYKNVIKIKQFYGPEDENYIFDDELFNLTQIISEIMESKKISTIYNVIDNVKTKYEVY
jgi:TFIIF-interacting CTD phosphatase-like protein